MKIVFDDVTMIIDDCEFRSIYPKSFDGVPLDQLHSYYKQEWYETLNGFKSTIKEAYFAMYYDYFISFVDGTSYFHGWYDITDYSLEYVKGKLESRGIFAEFIKG